MRRLLVSIIALSTLTSACSALVGDHNSSTATGDQGLAPLPLSSSEPIVAVVKAVLPSVVNVTTDQFRPNPLGVSGGGLARGVGTGFIIRSDGIIVTNCHVVESASKITVFLNAGSGDTARKFDARLIGSDCMHDLAVLKIGATGLPTVPLGNSADLQLGQRVVAIGFALDLTGGPTVTSGIVSSLKRTITAQDPSCDPQTRQGGARKYAGVIQTDAAINPGNSGGPLVNLQGQVVGIDTAGTQSAENIGFAIPIDDARDTIVTSESHPLALSAYLGVITETVNTDVAFSLGLLVQTGAYVVATPPDSPAAKAGLTKGDVIVKVNGTSIKDSDALGSALGGLKPGTG